MIFMAISSHQLIDLEWFCGGSLKHMCGTEAWTMAFFMIIQILWISPHLRGFPCQQGTMRNTVCLAFANKGRDTQSEEMPRHPKTWIATAIHWSSCFTGDIMRYPWSSSRTWEIRASSKGPPLGLRSTFAKQCTDRSILVHRMTWDATGVEMRLGMRQGSSWLGGKSYDWQAIGSFVWS